MTKQMLMFWFTFMCTIHLYTIILEQDCCYNDKNYMVLGYIPNLGYGKGKAKKQTAEMKLQDEHNCVCVCNHPLLQLSLVGQ
jgi:hypothetical protein